MAALQGKFYSHQAVDKDLTYCPPPQKLSTSGAAAPTGPRRLDGPQKSRTLASRTDTVVCEPPRRLGTGGSHPEDGGEAAARRLAGCTCRARFVPWVLLRAGAPEGRRLCAFEFGTAANSARDLDHKGQHSFMSAASGGGRAKLPIRKPSSAKNFSCARNW